jgi:predicted Zn-dependent protease
MQDQMSQTPKLAFAYAASLVRSGASDDGIPRLKALEAANPNSAELHYELAQAYQHSGKTDDAAQQMMQYEQLKRSTPPSK